MTICAENCLGRTCCWWIGDQEIMGRFTLGGLATGRCRYVFVQTWILSLFLFLLSFLLSFLSLLLLLLSPPILSLRLVLLPLFLFWSGRRESGQITQSLRRETETFFLGETGVEDFHRVSVRIGSDGDWNDGDDALPFSPSQTRPKCQTPSQTLVPF